jgi:hypothetical protein
MIETYIPVAIRRDQHYYYATVHYRTIIYIKRFPKIVRRKELGQSQTLLIGKMPSSRSKKARRKPEQL